MPDWEHVHQLLRDVAKRGEEAWPALVEHLFPELVRLARYQPIGRLRSDEDAHSEIATGVLERLRANGFRAVGKLFAAERPPRTRPWIRVLVRSAAIDFMRGQPEFVRGGARNEPGWISLHTLASGDGSTELSSIEAKRREVERFVEEVAGDVEAAVAEHGDGATEALARAWGVKRIHARRAVARCAVYREVLASVVAGYSYPEIGDRLGLSRREVELVVGYLEELLHARGFASAG